jgi:spore germination cell wall hydrolase CwlJ-like protein
MYNVILDQLSENEILTLTLYGEARGELIAGLVGVGCVIRNRVHGGKYKSYKEVCLAPKQFSCWNEDDTNYPILIEIANKLIMGTPIDNMAYRKCNVVAAAVINWIFSDETKAAEHYITTDLFKSNHRPSWAKKPVNTVELGRQTFFSV